MEALELQREIEAVRSLDQLTAVVERNPEDAPEKQELEQQVSRLRRTPVANPDALTRISRAHAAIGRPQEALENAEKAL